MGNSDLKALRTPTLAVVMAAFLAGFAGGLGAFLIERFVFPGPSLAIVDLPSIIGDHVTTPAVTSMPEGDRSAHAARFARQLGTGVARLARDYNAILLAAPAVVAGAPDLTLVLRTRTIGNSKAQTTGLQMYSDTSNGRLLGVYRCIAVAPERPVIHG